MTEQDQEEISTILDNGSPYRKELHIQVLVLFVNLFLEFYTKNNLEIKSCKTLEFLSRPY